MAQHRRVSRTLRAPLLSNNRLEDVHGKHQHRISPSLLRSGCVERRGKNQGYGDLAPDRLKPGGTRSRQMRMNVEIKRETKNKRSKGKNKLSASEEEKEWKWQRREMLWDEEKEGHNADVSKREKENEVERASESVSERGESVKM